MAAEGGVPFFVVLEWSSMVGAWIFRVAWKVV